MKKAVVVLCVVAVLLAIFGGVAAVKLAKTQDMMARLYFDEWYNMYRMTELVELSGEEMLPLVNHQGHYGLVNWSVDTEEVRMLLQDYETLLRLGITTDTEDITGTVLTEREAAVTASQVEEALEQFRGDILQVPPMYSALKVNGQKLYDLARKGKEVERQPRPITIHELTLLGMEAEGVRLRVRCSKGTYIRTLCKDIGQALGCGGCMAELRRVSAGEYTIAEAVPLQELLDTGTPEKYLRPVDTMFRACPACTLTENQEKRCRNGNPFSVKLPEGTYRAYSRSGEFLMLAQVENGTMSTVKSFFEV